MLSSSRMKKVIESFERLLQRVGLDEFWYKIRPHPMLPLWRRCLQWAAIGLGIGLISLVIFIFLIVVIFSPNLPPLDRIEDLLQAESTLILDREGNILYAIHGEENREIVAVKDISPYLIDATIAIEDDEFYDHFGFDMPCLGKAVLHEIFGLGIRRGCSTITQQLVKNLFLTPEQTYTRKIQELILAVRLETKFSKDDILELYLNEIPYGNNAYGAQLAAERYFGKSANELTLTESAILASLPKAPTRYSPYGENSHSYLLAEFTSEDLESRTIESIYDLNEEEVMRGLIGSNVTLANGATLYLPGRTDLVLDAMTEKGMITSAQAEAAKQESWTLTFKEYRESIQAPHFVLYVKQLLEDEYGKEVVEQGGLKVYTTLDPKLQELAEITIEKYRERNLTNYGANNASLVSIHPQTGQILAMVGSADYWNEEIDGNVNIALRPRQPGSSFKPFIYALTFLNGYAPATVVYDVRTQFGPGDYPQNYDGTYWGPTTIRKALGQSRNIPAIKAYFLAGKEEAIVPFLEKFGIDLADLAADDPGYGYGWPLALGSGEVTLLEMVEGYSVFANSGIKKEISPILKIENRAGDVLEQWEDEPGTEVLDPQAAYLITNILSDASISLGPRLQISGQYVATKTGTSNKKNEKGNNVPSNNWAMGYSTKLVTGVWIGNADGSELYYNADGYNTAAPIWNEFMTEALADLTPEEFPRPEGIVSMTVSAVSGLLLSDLIPGDKLQTDLFATFNIPTEIDDRFIQVKVDKTTGYLANEYCPEWAIEEKVFQIHKDWIPEYTYWQEGIDAWLMDNPDFEVAPTEEDPLHTAETLENAATIVITSPTSYGSVKSSERVTVEISIDAPHGVDKIEFYLNGVLQYTEVSKPYTGQVRIPIDADEGKVYTITAYIYDQLGYRGESSIEVQVKNETMIETPASEDSTTAEIN